MTYRAGAVTSYGRRAGAETPTVEVLCDCKRIYETEHTPGMSGREIANEVRDLCRIQFHKEGRRI